MTAQSRRRTGSFGRSAAEAAGWTVPSMFNEELVSGTVTAKSSPARGRAPSGAISAAEAHAIAAEVASDYDALLLSWGLKGSGMGVGLMVTSGSNVAPLSAYAPILLAEVFGVVDRDVIRQVSLGSLCLDQAGQVLDDLRDETLRRVELRGHLVALLVGHGLQLCVTACRRPSAVMDRLARYLREASAAERHLWKHHGRVGSYDRTDLAMMARRGAMVKASVAVWSEAEDHDDRLSTLERAVEHVALSVQLIDDLVDWKVDLERRIYTYPLAMVLLKRGGGDVGLMKGEIRQQLLDIGSGEKVLAMARESLERARGLFEVAGAAAMVLMIREWQEGVRRAEEGVRETWLSGRARLDEEDIEMIVRRSLQPLFQSH